MPVGTTTPVITYEGSPEAMAAWTDLQPTPATPTATDPLRTLSTGLGKIGEAIPILLLIAVAGAGLGLFGKFKRLF